MFSLFDKHELVSDFLHAYTGFKPIGQHYSPISSAESDPPRAIWLLWILQNYLLSLSADTAVVAWQFCIGAICFALLHAVLGGGTPLCYNRQVS